LTKRRFFSGHFVPPDVLSPWTDGFHGRFVWYRVPDSTVSPILRRNFSGMSSSFCEEISSLYQYGERWMAQELIFKERKVNIYLTMCSASSEVILELSEFYEAPCNVRHA
jgi:hypothetical protein